MPKRKDTFPARRHNSNTYYYRLILSNKQPVLKPFSNTISVSRQYRYCMHLFILVYYDELIMPKGPMNWTSARKPIILRPIMAQSRNRLGRIFLRFALPLTLGLVFLAQLAIVPNASSTVKMWRNEYSGNRMTNDTLRYAPEDIAAGVIDTYCISDTLVYRYCWSCVYILFSFYKQGQYYSQTNVICGALPTTLWFFNRE